MFIVHTDEIRIAFKFDIHLANIKIDLVPKLESTTTIIAPCL